MVDGALKERSPPCARLSSPTGRPSIPPEQWLRALLLQGLYTVRRERLWMEQRNDHGLFRGCGGLHLDDPVWDATVFSQHRERLLAGAVAPAFVDHGLAHARERELLSDEPCTPWMGP